MDRASQKPSLNKLEPQTTSSWISPSSTATARRLIKFSVLSSILMRNQITNRPLLLSRHQCPGVKLRRRVTVRLSQKTKAREEFHFQSTLSLSSLSKWLFLLDRATQCSESTWSGLVSYTVMESKTISSMNSLGELGSACTQTWQLYQSLRKETIPCQQFTLQT